jgi:hypothetical protein
MPQQRARDGSTTHISPVLRAVVLAVALGAIAVPLAAQVSTFDLSGVIKDEQGGVLPGVTVTMRNEATGLARTVVSDSNGVYYLANLPPQGTWELTTILAGFASHKQTKLEFYADTKPVLNIKLGVAAVQESVTVMTEAPLVDTAQATIGMTINKELIADLPLNGRDYLDLALLGSGVSDVGADNVAGSKSQTINGAYSRYTQYTMDGFSNTRDQHGVAKANVPMEAMSEFKVQTNQFSAEYGDTVGGIVTVVTKSGTNAVSGSAAFFGRPGSWDSPDPLTGVKAPFSRQDYSGAIGGPILKDRTHYFGAADYRNQEQQGVVTAPIGGGRFQGAFPLPEKRGRAFGKVDHSLDAANLLALSFLVDRDTSHAGVGGLNLVDNESTSIDNNTNVTATWTRVITDSRLNEFRIGYANESVQTSTGKPQFTPTGVALIYQGQGNLGSTNRLQTSPDKSFQIADTFTWRLSAHALKIGSIARSATPGGVLLTTIDGAYTFAPGTPYPYDPSNKATFPIQYAQGFFGNGSTEVSLNKWHVAAFVQDDWKIKSNLTLNLGARYQYESLVAQHANLRPRVGFAWDVTNDGKTVLRGGAGIFTGTVFSTVNAFEGFNGPNGFANVTFAPGDPLFPAYPNNLPGPQLPPGVKAPPANDYLDVPAFAPSRRKSPESQNFTIGIDRQIGSSTSVGLDFTFNRGINLLEPTNVNSPTYFDYSTGLKRTPQAGDASRPFGAAGIPIPAGAISYLPNGMPYGGYRDLYLIDSVGLSHYTAVGVQMNKRLSNNLSFQTQYTWSRAMNNGDGFRPNFLPLNPNDREAEWGRSETDVPHAFSLNGVYRMPYDVQVSGIVRAHSGSPVNPVAGVDLNGDRLLNDRPFANGVILGRNTFSTPAFVEADFGVGKAVRIGTRRIEGRIEAFNITNHLNPAAVNATYGPNANAPLATFLQINQSNPGRQYQLSAIVKF